VTTRGKLVAKGVDPSQQRKDDNRATVAAAHNTFCAVATDCLQKLRDEGRIEDTIEKNRWLLEALAKPLTFRPIADITSAEIWDLLKNLEKRGAPDTAHRRRQSSAIAE
jgi:hypothetical protein